MSSLPIFGTTIVRLHLGKQLHKVPDQVVVAGLRDDLRDLLRPGWYACLLFSDGRGLMRGPTEQTRQPAQDVRDKMVHVAELLNREHHEGGHWITIWSEGRLHLFWRDGDGDLQFTFEIDEPWPRVRAWPDTEFAARAVVAHSQWQEHMRAADRRQNELYRRALGERAPSLTH